MRQTAMFLRPSHFASRTRWFSVMVAVCLAPSLWAGQKIEYSVPASKVSAPNPAQEQRDAALFPKASSPHFDAPDVDFVPTPGIVVSAQPSRKKDSIFDKTDDKPDEANADQKIKTTAAKKLEREKNNGFADDPLNAKDAGSFSNNERNRAQKTDLKAWDSPNRSQHYGEGNSGRRESRDADSSWWQDSKSHDQSILGQTPTDANGQRDYKSFYERANLMSPTDKRDTPLHDSASLTPNANGGFSVHSASGLDRSWGKPEVPRSGIDAPSYRANLPSVRDVRAPSAGSGYFQQGTYTPPAPAPKRTAPSVLDFPKRPGDVLR